MTTAKPSRNSSRIPSIDALRGLAIILMALDHSRDYFGDMRIDCLDPATTNWCLFLTRWITHFCAPVFIFLAGLSAWLRGQKLGSPAKLTNVLFLRGLWLLLLEFTVIYFGIALSVGIVSHMFLVIAAIGSSMILLALVSRLPSQIVLILGLLIVGGHNVLDALPDPGNQTLRWAWMILHSGPGYIPELNLEVAYPILPWFGVMCLGYGMGPVFAKPPLQRQRILMLVGLGMLASFFLIRSLNGYGDPKGWEWQIADSPATTMESPSDADRTEPTTNFQRTVFSFLATTKYPPSLAYLMMTLGPALLLLSVLDRTQFACSENSPLIIFGRVPLFFYVVHFYVLHIASILTYWFVRGVPLSPFQAMYQQAESGLPEEFGFSTLWQVYLAWLILLVVMLPSCRLFSAWQKRRVATSQRV